MKETDLAIFEDLAARCRTCTACGLAAIRTNVVFGVGRPDAEVLFVGEGPGENEDLQGEPFVGRGGQLLDKMLAAVGLSRGENIYIANIVKCRPPKNRDPLPEEQDACIGWLKEQVSLLPVSYTHLPGTALRFPNRSARISSSTPRCAPAWRRPAGRDWRGRLPCSKLGRESAY